MRPLSLVCVVALSFGCRAARPAGGGLRPFATESEATADAGEDRRTGFAAPAPPLPFATASDCPSPRDSAAIPRATASPVDGRVPAVRRGTTAQGQEVLFVPRLVYEAYVRNPSSPKAAGNPVPEPRPPASPEFLACPPPPATPAPPLLPSIPPVPEKMPPVVTPRVISAPVPGPDDSGRRLAELEAKVDRLLDAVERAGKPEARK